MSKSTRLNALLMPLLILTLNGCWSDNPSDWYQDYLSRVARVQNVEKVTMTPTPLAHLPRKRELFIDIEPLSIGLLDSYQLRQCGLFNLIAERNSVLGKVADEFHRYDYQRQLLEGLVQCQANDIIDAQLKQKLAEIENHKQAQLNAHQWNLLYTSEAMQHQLSGNHWLEKALTPQVQQVGQALEYIQRAFSGEPYQIQQVQETLEKSAVIGNLDFSLVNATHQLDTVTRQLNTFDETIICSAQRDATKFKYLNNVFEQQYVGVIQPYMAQLDSYYQILNPVLTLFEPQPELHPYVYPLVNNHNQFRRAIRDHVNYWQQLFKRCGRQVG
ncbi:DUF3080 domain-containing protein [Vibrio salilacus]|uniref:DUF3080 domain-containing protein n=1 Tax=Vibrio salilacus TaxID=1323749 RepID=UPI000C2AFD93|nr:DUF3080 domain-containing protein [Vibrio salilacus]